MVQYRRLQVHRKHKVQFIIIKTETRYKGGWKCENELDGTRVLQKQSLLNSIINHLDNSVPQIDNCIRGQ